MANTTRNLAQIIVRRHKGKWVARSEIVGGKHEFADREKALKAAIDLAQDSGKNGRPAHVLLSDKKLPVPQVVWTYGTDAYPPSLSVADVALSDVQAGTGK